MPAPLDPVAYYQERKAHIASEPEAASLTWHDHGTMLEIPYEPEVARYGGTRLLPASERLFETSSDNARQLLAQSATRTATMTQAVGVMIAMATEFDVLNGAFFSWYAAQWWPFVPVESPFASSVQTLAKAQGAMLRTRIHGSQARSNGMLAWHEGVKRLLAEVAARASGAKAPASPEIAHLALSHIHMTNNRLGVLPSEELYLGLLLAHAHDESPEDESTRAGDGNTISTWRPSGSRTHLREGDSLGQG